MYISMNFKIDNINLNSDDKIILRNFISMIEKMPAVVNRRNIINNIRIVLKEKNGNDATFEYVELPVLAVNELYSRVPVFNIFYIQLANFKGKKMDLSSINALFELVDDLKSERFFNDLYQNYQFLYYGNYRFNSNLGG